MKKFTDLKTLTFGVWGLKTSLGQFGPNTFGRGPIKPLVKTRTQAPFFTNRTSFFQESWGESNKIIKSKKLS